MRYSTAQSRAIDAMLQAPEGTIDHTNVVGVRRTTVEALARMGAAEVTSRRTTRQVNHRDRTTGQRTVVTWTARIIPVMPDGDQLAVLDARAAERETEAAPLPLPLRRQTAAYLSLTAAKEPLAGAPATQPDWDTTKACTDLLRRHTDAELLGMYRAVRHITGQARIEGARTDAPPALGQGEATDVWTITVPENEAPGEEAAELCRVKGKTYVDATMAARALLGGRAFGMRRLRQSEVNGWEKDWPVHGDMLRLEREPGGARWQVRHVRTGDVMVVRPTPAEAMTDATLDMVSFQAALSS